MYLTRHSDMIKDINMDSLITVIGAGSIGSYTVLALAKLGFTNIEVADDGIVEEENIAPQFYRPRDIGKLKVDCLKRTILDQTGVNIITIPHKIVDSKLVTPNPVVLVLAVDSMSARKQIHNHISSTFLVDARMAIEFLTIISTKNYLNSGRMYYESTLFSDDDAVQETCTNKAISYTSLIAGGLVAKCVLDALKNRPSEKLNQTINFDINSFDMVRL